jgi:HEAT repeat protein
MIGLAPTAGSAARLIGGLEHGDDGVRAAAAEGLLHLGDRSLFRFAQERLPREPRPAIAALLARCTT